MRVSQKTEYALRAMLELARQAKSANPIRSTDIARSQRIPEKFLEVILVELRRANLVRSIRGHVGGHLLAREASRISVGDIWRAVDDDVLRNGHESKDHKLFAHIWNRVNHAVAEIVDGITLEDLRTRADSDQTIPDFSI